MRGLPFLFIVFCTMRRGDSPYQIKRSVKFMGKITVDFRKPGKVVARAVVADGSGWRQIFWEVKTEGEDLVDTVVAAGRIAGGLQEEKARVQNEASVPKGGI